MSHDPRVSAREALRRIIERLEAESTLLPMAGKQAIDEIVIKDLDGLLRQQEIFLKGKR